MRLLLIDFICVFPQAIPACVLGLCIASNSGIIALNTFTGVHCTAPVITACNGRRVT
jgi:hypothetical protein